jgi:hypothetical protein
VKHMLVIGACSERQVLAARGLAANVGGVEV